MKKFGSIFKKVRVDRNFKVMDLVEKGISKSHLYDFESEKRDISLGNFYKLLKKMNISTYEFEQFSKNYESEEFEKTWKYVADLSNNGNVETLKIIFKKEEIKRKEDGRNIYDELNYLMLKNLISRHDKQYTLKEKEKNIVSDYLSSIKMWCYFELSVYGNLLNVFDDSVIVELSENLIKRSTFYQSITRNRRLIVQILINTIISLIEKDELELAFRFKSEIEKLLTDTDLFEKTIFLFTKGMLDFYSGKTEYGKKRMQDAIEIFVLTGSHMFVEKYQKNYDDIINSQN